MRGRYPPIDTSLPYWWRYHDEDDDVIWTRNLLIVLPTLQPRLCQQLSIWYHCTTLLPYLHRQLQGKPTQLTSTATPHITTATSRTFITDQSRKRRFLNDTGSLLCVYPRKLIPQRRSRIYYDHCEANGTTILTYGWLALSINLGWRRNHTPRNPASQDTGDELLTLGASNILQRFEGQIPGTIVSTYCDTPAGQPRPYVLASYASKCSIIMSVSIGPTTRSGRHLRFPAFFNIYATISHFFSITFSLDTSIQVSVWLKSKGLLYWIVIHF
jgi:hypothetical protein